MSGQYLVTLTTAQGPRHDIIRRRAVQVGEAHDRTQRDQYCRPDHMKESKTEFFGFPNQTNPNSGQHRLMQADKKSENCE